MNCFPMPSGSRETEGYRFGGVPGIAFVSGAGPEVYRPRRPGGLLIRTGNGDTQKLCGRLPDRARVNRMDHVRNDRRGQRR